MQMIKPIAVTDSVLISSTVPEDDHAAWAATTGYVIGDLRIRLHRIYECLVDHTSTSTPPEDLTGGGTPTWVDVGPTNRWAMFDDVIGTFTSANLSLTNTLAPGNVSGLGFLELAGKTLDVTVTNGVGGSVVYAKSVDLDDTVIVSFWDYFFQDYVQKDTVVFSDLPGEYLNAQVIYSITGPGEVKCGVCAPGTVYELGDTDNGVTLRREDYSKKTTDAFGYISIVKRATRKVMSADIEVEFELFARLDRLMRDMQSELAIYVGVEKSGYETLIIYGFVKDFRVSIPYPKYLMCNIEVEGVV